MELEGEGGEEEGEGVDDEGGEEKDPLSPGGTKRKAEEKEGDDVGVRKSSRIRNQSDLRYVIFFLNSYISNNLMKYSEYREIY